MAAKIQELINQARSLQAEIDSTYGEEPYGHSDNTSPTWWLERGIEDFETALTYMASVAQSQRVVTDENLTRIDLLEVARNFDIITQAQFESGALDLSDQILRAQILTEFNY